MRAFFVPALSAVLSLSASSSAWADLAAEGSPTSGVANNQIEIPGGATPFADFPAAFCYVQNLNSLSLSGHAFSTLPACIQNHRRTLTQLRLTKNSKLTSLPDEIRNLTALENVNLDGNALAKLPDLSTWSSVVTLNLNNNSSLKLNDSVGSLQRLTTLSLQNDGLSSLPDSFSNLTNLTTLDLTGNPIPSVPSFLPYLINLNKLIVTGTPLATGAQKVILDTLMPGKVVY